MASISLLKNKNGISKPQNTGKMDPYARNQDKLSSNVSESTDFSSFKSNKKKKEDLNNQLVYIELKPAKKKVSTKQKNLASSLFKD